MNLKTALLDVHHGTVASEFGSGLLAEHWPNLLPTVLRNLVDESI